MYTTNQLAKRWPMSTPTTTTPANPPRLLDQVRTLAQARFGRPEPGQRYTHWITRFILFHGKRHPRELGGAAIEMFLSDLAVRSQVSSSTQNQALNALLYLYREVLGIELPRLDAVRAKRPKRLPTVLSVEEMRLLLDAVDGGEG